MTVAIDGNVVSFNVEPQLIDNGTMVPLRKIFEELGAVVKWNDELKTVYARKGSKTVELTADSSSMKLSSGDMDENGNPITEEITLDVPMQMVGERCLVPTRAISEAFSLNVDWDEEKQQVDITTKEPDDEWKSNTGREFSVQFGNDVKKCGNI